MPCFNQGEYAQTCIDSLAGQTFANWKAVLLDDASTDGISPTLCNEVRHPRVAVHHLTKNLGRALIRNEGVARLGPVDYVLMVDCDDYLEPQYIEKLVAALDAHPSAGLAYGLLHWVGDVKEGQKGLTWPTRLWSREAMFLENDIPGPGVLFRKHALDEVTGWRADFTHCSGEDYDIWLQIVSAGWDAIWVKNARYNYRQHAQSFLATADQEKAMQVRIGILKNHRSEIAKRVGIRSYLRKTILPSLLAAIHRRDGNSFKRISGPLLRICGPQLIFALAVYYFRRLPYASHEMCRNFLAKIGRQ